MICCTFTKVTIAAFEFSIADELHCVVQRRRSTGSRLIVSLHLDGLE